MRSLGTSDQPAVRSPAYRSPPPPVGEQVDLTLGDITAVAQAFSTPWCQRSANPDDDD